MTCYKISFHICNFESKCFLRGQGVKSNHLHTVTKGTTHIIKYFRRYPKKVAFLAVLLSLDRNFNLHLLCLTQFITRLTCCLCDHSILCQVCSPSSFTYQYVTRLFKARSCNKLRQQAPAPLHGRGHLCKLRTFKLLYSSLT